MKKNWLLTVVVILMSVSAHSQIWLQKTVYNKENAFIGNEAAMDTIALRLINLKVALSTIQERDISVLLYKGEARKLNLQIDFLNQDNFRLEAQKTTLKDQMVVKDKIHEVDLLYYKQKSKGNLSNFLFGTATGALIVAIVAVLAK